MGVSIGKLSKDEQTEDDLHDANRGKQILIAEDEPSLRSGLQELLRSWGYRTLVTSDGMEGLAVAAAHPNDIDLLLSDITMPKMSGLDLAQELTTERPLLRVILMYGFPDTQVVLEEGWKFVQKPFKPKDIERMVKEIL